MKLKQEDFANLLKASLEGNKNSYRILLENISTLLENYLVKRIFDKDDKEDILQEILMSFHSARHTYLLDKPFFPWLYGIAKNHLSRYYHLKSKKQNEILNFEMNLFPKTEVEETDSTKMDSLLLELKNLPERQKKIITLLKFQGKTVEQVAKIMNLSNNNVKVIAHRGYEKLKRTVYKKWKETN
jgi:RNA polymerase sigma-70 factor (ECF subfamily)